MGASSARTVGRSALPSRRGRSGARYASVRFGAWNCTLADSSWPSVKSTRDQMTGAEAADVAHVGLDRRLVARPRGTAPNDECPQRTAGLCGPNGRRRSCRRRRTHGRREPAEAGRHPRRHAVPSTARHTAATTRDGLLMEGIGVTLSVEQEYSTLFHAGASTDPRLVRSSSAQRRVRQTVTVDRPQTASFTRDPAL